MIQISHPGWRPSPLWAMRWVAVYVGIILMTYVAGIVLYGTDRGHSLFGPRWEGTSAACRSASAGPDGMYLLTADGAPSVDPETGLAVARFADWGGSAIDLEYAAAWNAEMRMHFAATPIPRRFDGHDTDGASIRRRFEARAADVVEFDAPGSHPSHVSVDVAPRVIGGLTVLIRHASTCMSPRVVHVRGREIAYPGGSYIRRVHSADGTVRRGGYRRAWIPYGTTYRALLSDDGRQLWLVGPASTDDGRAATWTATIDVATAATVGVDYVEGL